MDANTLSARISAANDKYIDEADELYEGNQPEDQEAPTPPPVDIYSLMAHNRMLESRMKRPNGASPRIKDEVDYVVNGFQGSGLKAAYNMAKAQSDSLYKRGDTLRAKMLKDQYMDEKFLPAVEALVRLTSADEVINSTDALNEMDKLVLTNGGNPAGFTRSFVEQLYRQDLGTTMPSSDAHVSEAVRRISGLIQSDQIRTAVGLATKTLASIEAGQHSADDSDYELLLKVAERGQ